MVWYSDILLGKKTVARFQNSIWSFKIHRRKSLVKVKSDDENSERTQLFFHSIMYCTYVICDHLGLESQERSRNRIRVTKSHSRSWCIYIECSPTLYGDTCHGPFPLPTRQLLCSISSHRIGKTNK
jgi:hypothetical protein